MDSKTSEIEAIIKSTIEEETKKSIADITALIVSQTQAAVDRINGVYTSAVKTLEQLELADATIFDFFQKTGGNIWVAEYVPQYHDAFTVQCGMRNVFENQRPMFLKQNTKYRIILMAMEIKDTEKKDKEGT